MNRRRLGLLLLACVLMVTAGILLWPREREPEYQGVSLTGWLTSYDSGVVKGNRRSFQKNEEAASAVRYIGTNSIPFLLQWMSAEPAPWRRQWRNTFQKLPHPVDRLGRLSDSVYGLKWQLRNRLALDGFEILGPDAASAIPDLIRIMRGARSERLWFAAVHALGSIGKDGLAPLIAALEESPVNWRHNFSVMSVITSMEEKGINITAALPAMLQSAGDTNYVVRSGAWLILEQLSPEKFSLYLPVLAASLHDTNEAVRVSAATLLVDIATNVQPALLTEATNVLRSAPPELLERIGDARSDE